MTDRYANFLLQLKARDPSWVSEHRFHPVRKWRFDFANTSRLLAIEVDGGVWTGGRHSRGAGQVSDMEKGNTAILLGWRVLHFTPSQISKGEALRFISDMLANS